MLNLKRGPQDPILPLRATKHPRTTALYGDRPTASQSEGLLSQWISSLVTLTHRAASGIFNEPLRGPPSQSSQRADGVVQPTSLSVQPITLRSTHLPRRKSPKLQTKKPSPRSGSAKFRDSPPRPSSSTKEGQSATRSRSPHIQQSVEAIDNSISVRISATDPPSPVVGHISAALPHPSGAPSTPVPDPAKSVSRALSVARPFPFRPPLPGSYLSPSIETPAPKPPYVPQTPQTEPRVEAIYNPYYRSMAPPPSPNLPRVPTPRPQPPDTESDIEPRPSSTTASTTASTSTSTLPAPREVVDAAIAVAEKKLAGRMVKRVFSRKGARQHIFQGVHKARVLESRKEDQESLMKHLFELERARGYSSDFQTFQGFVKYRELLDGQGLMSPRSLNDLRGRYQNEDPRRHSFGDTVTPDYLERALQKARETLNGPKPPPPFIPSFEQLRIARRDRDAEINSRLRGPPLPDSLTSEQDAEVSRVLKKRGVIAKVARLQVVDADLCRLKPGTWLNDEIINFYGQLILERSEAHPNKGVKNGARSEKNTILNVHYFNSFFFEKLSQEGYEKARLAKWTKKFDLFSKDIALLPINHGNSHWTAAAINFRRRRIESFDSMGARRQDIFDLLREYVEQEHLNKKSRPFDWTGWANYSPRDTPQQENGYDCGVFTCQFLEALSRGMDSPFNFTQRSMAYLRRRMILEIARTELLGGT